MSAALEEKVEAAHDAADVLDLSLEVISRAHEDALDKKT